MLHFLMPTFRFLIPYISGFLVVWILRFGLAKLIGGQLILANELFLAGQLFVAVLFIGTILNPEKFTKIPKSRGKPKQSKAKNMLDRLENYKS